MVSLNCDVFSNSAGIVEIDSVNLMLPKTKEEYCIDSLITDHQKCSSEFQCSCCTLTNTTITKTIQQGFDACHHQTSCKLEVRSEFYHNCPGITYDCEGQKCHSRWAQVNYRCIPCSPGAIEKNESENTGKVAIESNFQAMHVYSIDT